MPGCINPALITLIQASHNSNNNNNNNISSLASKRNSDALLEVTSKISPNGPRTYVHAEADISAEADALCAPVLVDAKTFFRPLRLVLELAESLHLSPRTLVDSYVVLLTQPVYALSDVLDAALVSIAGNNHRDSYRALFQECLHTYVLPAMAALPTLYTGLETGNTDTDNSDSGTKSSSSSSSSLGFFLPEHCLRMADSVLAAFGVDRETYEPRLERSVRRAVLFAVVWTVGVRVRGGRESFDSWFRNYFYEDLHPDTGLEDEEEEGNCGGSGEKEKERQLETKEVKDLAADMQPVHPQKMCTSELEGWTVFDLRLLPRERPTTAGIFLDWDWTSSRDRGREREKASRVNRKYGLVVSRFGSSAEHWWDPSGCSVSDGDNMFRV